MYQKSSTLICVALPAELAAHPALQWCTLAAREAILYPSTYIYHSYITTSLLSLSEDLKHWDTWSHTAITTAIHCLRKAQQSAFQGLNSSRTQTSLNHLTTAGVLCSLILMTMVSIYKACVFLFNEAVASCTRPITNTIILFVLRASFNELCVIRCWKHLSFHRILGRTTPNLLTPSELFYSLVKIQVITKEGILINCSDF